MYNVVIPNASQIHQYYFFEAPCEEEDFQSYDLSKNQRGVGSFFDTCEK